MKRSVVVAIIVVVVGLLAISGWRAATFFGGLFDDLQAQSHAIAAQSDEAAAAIVADWAPQALKPYATPQFFAALEQAGFSSWKAYKALGEPVTLKPCTVPSLTITNGRGIALATCPATFPNGDGALSFDYNNDDGEWKIAAVKVAF